MSKTLDTERPSQVGRQTDNLCKVIPYIFVPVGPVKIGDKLADAKKAVPSVSLSHIWINEHSILQ